MRALLGVLVLAAAVRAPFWEVALHTPIDGDTAIVGLMARHPTRSATLWGQPYGSPLDAWVAAPFEAAFGPGPAGVRLPYAVLSLALVAAVFLLGEVVRAGAGLPAALLMACPPAYFLLLSALPPPLYPTTLVLLAAVLALAAQASVELGAHGTTDGRRLAALGALSGLAAWTHLMSLATLAVAMVVIAWSARRARGRLRLLAWVVIPFVLASGPWWLRALRDPAAMAVLGVAHEGSPALAHAATVASRMDEAVAGLLGTWTPVTADEAGRTARAPLPLRLLLVTAWAIGVGAGIAALRGRATAALLGGAVALTMAAFPFPVRSEPHTLRFLTPALAPLAVLGAVGAVRLAGRARAWLLVLPLCAAHLGTGALLLGAWRGAGPEGLVPECTRVIEVLARHGIRRAYASYHTAYCVTYTSGETVIASQPWNERFYGQPLPYLDEVRFAARVAWVLVPGADFELPAPRTFESKLAGIGGRFARAEAAPAFVYLDFVPPFAPTAAPHAVPGPPGDGNVTTRVVEPPAGGVTFALSRPVAAAGLTLLAGTSAPGLPRSMNVEVSADGQAFERIGRRRRGRETVDLAWVNGHPQFLIDDLAFSAPLDGRTIAAVRIVPSEHGAWGLSELLIHPAGPPSPWTAEEMGGTWAERAAVLASRPRPADAAGLYRSLLAERARAGR
jgi:4-amino-4-deoxy-L-arabinose transferase-like glycosyltransferase